MGVCGEALASNLHQYAGCAPTLSGFEQTEANVALPKSTETTRTLELQAIVSAIHEKEMEA